jgi:hypothetical protein
MATNTYVALDKVTVVTATPSLTFSSIPATYTDLVIVANCKNTTGATYGLLLQYNGDTTANYSTTLLWGNGTSSSTFRYTTQYNAAFTGWAGNTNFTPLIINIPNYSNSTTYKTTLSRSSDPGDRVGGMVSLWRKTPETVNSITISFEPTTNIAVGSTFELYGVLQEGVSPTTKATGGAVYSDDTYYYHVFGASGTFTPTQSITADYIVVAGGGGGGGTTGGGGGAGGFYSTTLASLSATNYSITVGAGGAGGTNNGTSGSAGSKGSDSSFNSITRTGGGGGGTSPNIPTYAATTGGSGGGGSRSGSSQPGAAGNQGAYTPVEGYAGGNNFTGGGVYGTGGGGGAGGVGQAGTSTTDGAGGIGATSGLITAIVKATGNGELVSGTGYIAGGGGGACGDAASITNSGAPGGLGGGGKGGSDSTLSSSINGKAGTGSGGGGSPYISGYLSGARGGSGVVIIRYVK